MSTTPWLSPEEQGSGESLLVPEAVAALWSAGVLLWKVRPHQLGVYEFLSEADGLPLMQRLAYVHRQFGKSYLALLIAVEYALQHPAACITVFAPSQKMLRSIMLPNMTRLLNDCPDGLRPRFNGVDNVFTFPSSGSVIRIDGADQGNAENARGRANNLVVIDEAGFIRDLKGLIKDIILPSFLTTGGRLIAITTPPKSAGHYCAALRQDLDQTGAFVKVRLSENPTISPDVRKRYADESGGEDSASFRREYECDEITDAEAAVVPEFDTVAQGLIVRKVPPADPYTQRITSMDLGWADPTAVLYGHYHFPTATLCVQKESLLKRARIDQIADEVRSTEQALWGSAPQTRISDIDPLVLSELASKYNLPFRPVTKQVKEQMVNAVRTWVRERRLVIDPDCSGLIAQLEAAIWTATRRAFEHTPAFGHFDLVDALIYMVQGAPVHLNPYPVLGPDVTDKDYHIHPEAFRPRETRALQDLFRPAWSRR